MPEKNTIACSVCGYAIEVPAGFNDRGFCWNMIYCPSCDCTVGVVMPNGAIVRCKDKNHAKTD